MLCSLFAYSGIYLSIKPEDFRSRIFPPAADVALDAPAGRDHTSDFISFGVRLALKISGFFNLSAKIHTYTDENLRNGFYLESIPLTIINVK